MRQPGASRIWRRSLMLHQPEWKRSACPLFLSNLLHRTQLTPFETAYTAASRPATLWLLALIAFSAILVTPCTAQYLTDGFTPAAFAQGEPTGSYELSGFENINSFNGSMNFHLPILTVHGRGDVGYTMFVAIDQHWLVHHPLAQAAYYNPAWFGQPLRPGYRPGTLQGRTQVSICQPNGTFTSITRLTFVSPNGTEHELIDQKYQGQTKTLACGAGLVDRGTVFTSDGGEAMTFISDTSIQDNCGVCTTGGTGYLLFPNGSRYRINGG